MSPVEAAHFKIWNPIDFHCKTLVRNYWHCRISQKLLKFLQDVLGDSTHVGIFPVHPRIAQIFTDSPTKSRCALNRCSEFDLLISSEKSGTLNKFWGTNYSFQLRTRHISFEVEFVDGIMIDTPNRNLLNHHLLSFFYTLFLLSVMRGILTRLSGLCHSAWSGLRLAQAIARGKWLPSNRLWARSTWILRWIFTFLSIDVFTDCVRIGTITSEVGLGCLRPKTALGLGQWSGVLWGGPSGLTASSIIEFFRFKIAS